MADMNNMKDKLENILAVNGKRAAVAAGKSDYVICVFRLDSLDDVETMGEALKKNFLVLLDITTCDEECARRTRDFMKGAVYPMQVRIQEMSENILVYLSDGYQIQELQS